MSGNDNRSGEGCDPPTLDDIVVPGEFVDAETAGEPDKAAPPGEIQLDDDMLSELAARIADEIHEQITPALETVINEVVEETVRRIIDAHSQELRHTIHERLHRTLPLLIEQAVSSAKDRGEGGR